MISVVRDGYCYGCDFFEMELREDKVYGDQDLVCVHEDVCNRLLYFIDNGIKPDSDEYKKIVNDEYESAVELEKVKYIEEKKQKLEAEGKLGQWINVKPALLGGKYATCSVCGKRMTLEDMNYCPNCGMEMNVYEVES